MKIYPQNKFVELASERQARVVLDLIAEIENLWNESRKKDLIDTLKNYFAWMELHKSEIVFFKKLSLLEFRIHPEMPLRELLDLAVPLERFLDVSLKDDALIPVREGDNISKQRNTFPIVLVLDHLRSAFNVGSLFRSSECLGVKHIYLVGYTPTPDDKSVQKTAMGTEQWVGWSQVDSVGELINELKAKGYSLMALETCAGAVKLNDFNPSRPIALFAGNERFGLSQEVIQQMDSVIEIPMHGAKNSLNVANSVSIAIYYLINKM